MEAPSYAASGGVQEPDQDSGHSSGQWGTSRIISYYEVKLKPTPSSSEAWFPIVRGEVQVQ